MENIFINGATYIKGKEQGIEYVAYHHDTMQIKIIVTKNDKVKSKMYDCQSTLLFGLFGEDADEVNDLLQEMLEDFGWEGK